MTILVFDPGDHTGWVATNGPWIRGGTIFSQKSIMDDISELNKLWLSLEPDVVVFETFNLYPGAAAHLTHNEFYPCQIIGVIKTLCWINSTQFLVPQAPSIKKYSGGLDERWKIFSKEIGSEKSEHMKDAYLHLKYYKLFNSKKLNKYKISPS